MPDPVPPKPPADSLYGCMRGTVVFHPDVDLTQPTGETWDIDDEPDSDDKP